MKHTTLLLVFVLTTQVSWGQASTWDAADLSARGTVRFTELLQTLEPLRFLDHRPLHDPHCRVGYGWISLRGSSGVG